MTKQEWHPDIDITTTLAKNCIGKQFSALNPITDIKVIGEGWDNKVFLVNNSVIFRFPHREVSIQLIERENAILDALQHKISLNIPHPTYHGQPTDTFPYPFHGYKALNGIAGYQAELTLEERIASIAPLAIFLKELHNINEYEAKKIGAKPSVFDRTDLSRIIKGSLERIDILSQTNVIKLSKDGFYKEVELVQNANKPTTHTLVHGDLYSRHLFYEDKKLTGIIDWGDSGINSPAVDLAVVYSFYPVEAHAQFFEIYGEVDTHVLTYARFIALHSSIAVLIYAHDVNDKLLYQEAYDSLKRISPGLLH